MILNFLLLSNFLGRQNRFCRLFPVYFTTKSRKKQPGPANRKRDQPFVRLIPLFHGRLPRQHLLQVLTRITLLTCGNLFRRARARPRPLRIPRPGLRPGLTPFAARPLPTRPAPLGSRWDPGDRLPRLTAPAPSSGTDPCSSSRTRQPLPACLCRRWCHRRRRPRVPGRSGGQHT